MKIVKNNKSTSDVWCGQEISSGASFVIQQNEIMNWQTNSKVLSDISSGALIVNNGTSDLTDAAVAINFFLDANQPITLPPFAEPLHRTKLDACDSVFVCSSGSQIDIDYQLTAERYVSGGELITKNSELGDWISASIVDKDGVIPVAYRASLCEAWPVVAEYIKKQFAKPYWNDTTKISYHDLDMSPLTAKITPGLYLRLTYHSVATGSDRLIALNYKMTKKL